MQINYPPKFTKIYSVILDLGETISEKITDFTDRIYNNPKIKREFYNIDFVYMHSIILDLAKMVGLTGSDKSGLKELGKICDDSEIKKMINDFENSNVNILNKIKSNRSRIIAHVDISDRSSYFNMGFSELEIDNKIKDHINYSNITKQIPDESLIQGLKKLKSESTSEERYSPTDFYNDIPKFKKLIDEIKLIVDTANKYFYTKNNTPK